jgi:hypothetical protein
VALPPLEQRQRAFQHQFLEVRCLLVIGEGLFVFILFV